MSERLASLAHALTSPSLLRLGAPSWLTWRSVLRAAHGETLTTDELRAFAGVSGGRAPPLRKVRTLAVVASRRSGKGRAAGALAAYASALMDHSAALAPGERGFVACISPTRAQAQIVKDYTRGYFEASPVLSGELLDVTDNELRLRNGVAIVTLASDYRTLRGRTLLLAVLDEASFLRDEAAATPDVEAARALLPGLATTNGMLVVLSSPYRRNGLLYALWRKSRLVRSDLYLEGAPLFSRGLISIPPEPAILLRELRLLERRTARSGRDSVDHGTGGSDDFANALFGAMHLAADKASDEVNTAIWGAPGWGILSGGPRQYFGDAGVGTAASVGLAAAAARGIPPG